MNSIEQEKLPVMISVRGEQYFDDVDPNATELMTEGTLEQTEDGFLLSYQETELTGMEGTLTTFEIGPGRVILRRSGSVNSQMVFEEGKQHTSLYETPFGDLSVDILLDASSFLEAHGPINTTLASGCSFLISLAVATIGVRALDILSIVSGKNFLASIAQDGQQDVRRKGTFPVATSFA